MKRGEIWTLAGGADYAHKPRPAVIVQDDRFDATESITVCLLTRDDHDLPTLRVPLVPSKENGLLANSNVMIEKLSTVPKTKLGYRIGRLEDQDMVRVSQALAAFLGISA